MSSLNVQTPSLLLTIPSPHPGPSRLFSSRSLKTRERTTSLQQRRAGESPSYRRHAQEPSTAHIDMVGPRDPVTIGGEAAASVYVDDKGGELRLDRYMRLPVEQYVELDSNLITMVEGNVFRIRVPRLSFFHVWIQPTVDVAVELVDEAQRAPRVVLQARRCRLDGSQWVKDTNLDKRFRLKWLTELTWSKEELDVADDGRSLSSKPSVYDRRRFGDRSRLEAVLWLEIETEVVSPFTVVPRDVLVSTCNIVLKACMRTLLPAFIKELGKDYRRWSEDGAYRRQRANRGRRRGA